MNKNNEHETRRWVGTSRIFDTRLSRFDEAHRGGASQMTPGAFLAADAFSFVLSRLLLGWCDGCGCVAPTLPGGSRGAQRRRGWRNGTAGKTRGLQAQVLPVDRDLLRRQREGGGGEVWIC